MLQPAAIQSGMDRGVRLLLPRAQAGFSAIRQPRRKADPAIAVARFEDMLREKQSNTLKVAKTPWLALVIEDLEQAEADALKAIEASLAEQSLGQFARIIVGYERGALTRYRPFRIDATAYRARLVTPEFSRFSGLLVLCRGEWLENALLNLLILCGESV